MAKRRKTMSHSAEDIFEEFHGVAPTRAIRVRVVALPEEVAVMGRVVSFVYESISDGSRRTGHRWEHIVGDTGGKRVDTELYVCVAPNGRDLHFVTVKRGGKGRYPVVNRRGIVG